MPTDEFKKAVAELAPCHRCGQPGALTSTKGYPFCSNSNCVLFEHKMPLATWNKLSAFGNVVQLPATHNINLQRVVDAMIYVWHNRQDQSAIGALEDVINDYESGRPETHAASLLEHAAFKAKRCIVLAKAQLRLSAVWIYLGTPTAIMSDALSQRPVLTVTSQ